MEEELLKSQKTHEDEVNLRLKFEEKLNNLHALNRVMTQNYNNTSMQLENLQKNYNDLLKHFKELQKELGGERVKIATLESKNQYAEDKCSHLQLEIYEWERKQLALIKQNQETQDRFQLANYRHEIACKNYESEKVKIENLNEENKLMKASMEHYKNCFDSSLQKVKVLEERLKEINDSNAKNHNELTFYKQQYVGFQSVQTFRAEEVQELKEKIRELEDKIIEIEKERSEVKAQFNIADQELQTLRVDYKESVEKLEKISKARQEAEYKIKAKNNMLRILEEKLKEREDHINKNIRKIHELDERVMEQEHVINNMGQDKQQTRIDHDQVRRQQLDKIHTLEEMNRNERELRQQWSEKYEKETRLMSIQNVELMDLKTRIAESDGKIKHLQVELLTEKQMIDSLVKSKRELMNTLNKYVVKCESQESDITAMREVTKHFEENKQKEFKSINDTVQRQFIRINQLEMQNEDYYTRLSNYSETILNQRSSILKMALELEIHKSLGNELKTNILEKAEQILLKEGVITKYEDEIMVSKNSYKLLKTKLANQITEFDNLNSLYKELQEKNTKNKQKKKEFKKLSEDQNLELSQIKEIRMNMQQNSTQTYPHMYDAEIQCNIGGGYGYGVSPNQSSSAHTNSQITNNTRGIIKNEPSKFEQTKKLQQQKQREVVLQASKFQNDLNSKYDINKVHASSQIQQTQQQQQNSEVSYYKQEPSNDNYLDVPETLELNRKSHSEHPSISPRIRYISNINNVKKIKEEVGEDSNPVSDQEANNTQADGQVVIKSELKKNMQVKLGEIQIIKKQVRTNSQVIERNHPEIQDQQQYQETFTNNNLMEFQISQEDTVIKEIENTSKLFMNQISSDTSSVQRTVQEINQQRPKTQQIQQSKQETNRKIKSLLKNAFHER